MLLDEDDMPIIIAQDAGGKTGIYKPANRCTPNSTEPACRTMAKVGDFTPARPAPPTPRAVGHAIVTGAAKSRRRQAGRHPDPSDAYEFDVGADGDVVKAITTGKPRVTPLPNEPDGRGDRLHRRRHEVRHLSGMPTARPRLRSC